MNLINICGNCGARNYFSRKYCGNCGQKLSDYNYNQFRQAPSFSLSNIFGNITTTKLLIGVIAVVIIAVVAVVIWQFSPKADSSGPVISNIVVDYKTASSARITWQTSEPSSSQVEYGLTTNFGMLNPLTPANDPTLDKTAGVTSHVVILKGLRGNTTYYFRVKSKDVNGNESTSKEYLNFRTGEVLPFAVPD